CHAGVVARIGGVDARLSLLQCSGLRVYERLRIEISEVRLLRLENDVLNLLIVRVVGGDERLTRLFHLRRASAEIEQQICERELRAECGAVENRAAALRRLS